VCPGFQQPAVAEYDDQVRVRGGGRPVRHHDRGPARGEHIDRGRHLRLGAQVQRRRGFVEDQDVGFHELGAGRGRQPTLPRRDSAPVLTDGLQVPVVVPTGSLTRIG
jgi:hypothetical protein